MATEAPAVNLVEFAEFLEMVRLAHGTRDAVMADGDPDKAVKLDRDWWLTRASDLSLAILRAFPKIPRRDR